MITLTADTRAILVPKQKTDKYYRLTSDSATMTRIGYSEESIEMSYMGFCFTMGDNIIVYLPAGKEIHAISAGTPHIGVAEVRNTAIVLG